MKVGAMAVPSVPKNVWIEKAWPILRLPMLCDRMA